MWQATTHTSRNFATFSTGRFLLGQLCVTTKSGPDIPTISSSSRGSFAGALAAALPDLRAESQYANNTGATRDSRWGLWVRLSEQWQLPPFPLTIELVSAIGASLKAGGYRSAAQVFGMARQQHVLIHKIAVPVNVEQHIKETIRSIERGIGPPALNDSFLAEDLGAVHTGINTEPITTHWSDDSYYCVLATLVCCWWMLRGIKMAAAQRKHVWFEHTNFGKFAFLTLPCQKNDTVGNFVTRSHPCLCPDNLSRICPYHALEQFIVRTAHQRSASADNNKGYLFPGVDEVFRRAIAAIGASLTRAGPDGQVIHRFNEHVCRVSGAQLLTRLSYPVEAVQLIGRWGSEAVKRYIQDTPLTCNSSPGPSSRTVATRATTEKSIKAMVKRYLIFPGSSGSRARQQTSSTSRPSPSFPWKTVSGRRSADGLAAHQPTPGTTPFLKATSANDASASRNDKV